MPTVKILHHVRYWKIGTKKLEINIDVTKNRQSSSDNTGMNILLELLINGKTRVGDWYSSWIEISTYSLGGTYSIDE